MKKFTKGCLITALVLFIVGLAISLVGGVLGGFRQLRELETIGGIPVNISAGSGLEFGVFNSEVGKNWEKDGYFEIAEGKENGIFMNADAFTELDIALSACNLYLEESPDDQIRVYCTGDTLRYYWRADGSTLCLRNAGKVASHTKDKVHVSIPADYTFRELEIDFGAGVLEAPVVLSARELNVSMGAGSCVLQGVMADNAELSVGAGELTVYDLTARETDIEVGAGDLTIDEITVSGEADITMSMGNATVNGTIEGELSLECDMGEVSLLLTGSEDDHSYTVECGMGNVQIGRNNYGGFATERTWNAGKNSQFEVDCNMGTVTIMFQE